MEVLRALMKYPQSDRNKADDRYSLHDYRNLVELTVGKNELGLRTLMKLPSVQNLYLPVITGVSLRCVIKSF